MILQFIWLFSLSGSEKYSFQLFLHPKWKWNFPHIVLYYIPSSPPCHSINIVNNSPCHENIIFNDCVLLLYIIMTIVQPNLNFWALQ